MTGLSLVHYFYAYTSLRSDLLVKLTCLNIASQLITSCTEPDGAQQKFPPFQPFAPGLGWGGDQILPKTKTKTLQLIGSTGQYAGWVNFSYLGFKKSRLIFQSFRNYLYVLLTTGSFFRGLARYSEHNGHLGLITESHYKSLNSPVATFVYSLWLIASYSYKN